jgi:subtilisin family serine protease
MGGKTIWTWLLLLSFSVSWGQSLLPFSVVQFMDEHARAERLKSQQSVLQIPTRYAPARIIDGQEMVDAFIAISNENVVSALQNEGVIVNCIFGGFVTAQIPVDKLCDISLMRGVTDVEISRKIDLCTDTTMRVTHVGQVLNGLDYGLPQNYDGSGVIVGVIDTGFDFQHRAFMQENDATKNRIVRVYNTHDDSGHPARYNKNVRMPGSVFIGNEIYNLTTDLSGGTHGTHTASIAAGTHVNGYGGMAPKADIVLCAVRVLDGGMSLIEVANCVRYIDSYADSVGKPCVISVSVSTGNGQHDGNDYLTKAISQIVGAGRLFVISAGNNGNKPFYSHKFAKNSDPLNLLLYSYSSNKADSTYYYGGHYSETWMRKNSVSLYYRIHVLDKKNNSLVWQSAQFSGSKQIDVSEFGNYYTFDPSVDTTGFIKAQLKTSSDGKKYGLEIEAYNLLTKSYSTVNDIKKSRYAIGISICPRYTPCEIDAWTYVSKSGFGTYKSAIRTYDGNVVKDFYSAVSDSCSIGSYAIGDSIISAGAFVARNSYYSLYRNTIIEDHTVTIGDICSFSSYQAAGAGPTGYELPTICAPGFNVVAAGSRYSYFANRHINTVMKSDDGSYWGVMSGSSMAAPTVAGIIALWLQAKPNLSVSEAKNIMAQTAIKDYYTLGGKNSIRFGPNGKIDAMAGMQLVLEHTKIITGDVNGDGRITIADLTSIIDYILSGNGGESFVVEAADVNSDGEVSIADVTVLIDMILSSN